MKLKQVTSEVLLETSQSWDGAELPAYPTGTPKITIVKTSIPPNTKLQPHRHSIINCGVVMKGTLKVIKSDGQEMTITQGDAASEVIGDVHYAINEGDETVELIVFYAGDKEAPLSIKP